MANVKCEYCETIMDDTLAVCPVCNASNKNYKRLIKDTPKTIIELQQWMRRQTLPPKEIVNFVIGTHVDKRKTYILSHDNRTFELYYVDESLKKNQKYKGTDEAYVCNLFYQIIRDESTKYTVQTTQLTQGNVRGFTKISKHQELANCLVPKLRIVFWMLLGYICILLFKFFATSMF